MTSKKQMAINAVFFNKITLRLCWQINAMVCYVWMW